MPKYDCPVCEGHDCVSSTPSKRLITCMGPGCIGLDGGDWLRAVAKAVDAPGGGDILANPDKWLERATGSVDSFPGPDSRGSLPDIARFQGWSERLWSQDGLATQAREWLNDRGIKNSVIKGHLIGWNGTELVLPLRDEHDHVVTAKLRRIGPGHKTIAWPGIGRDVFPLYPWPYPEWPAVLVCEGELDALAAWSVGLPSTAVTLGANAWMPRWNLTLFRWWHWPIEGYRAGRRVAVCFDVGAEEAAERVVAELCEAGARARAIHLPGPRAYDVTDFLMEHSGRELRDLINEQWRPSRRSLASRSGR